MLTEVSVALYFITKLDNICDRVSTQSKKLKDAILVAFDRGRCGLEKWVWMRKHREIYLHSIRMSVQCIRTSVQCIQAKTT